MTKKEFRNKLFNLLCECELIDNEGWEGTDKAIEVLEYLGVRFKKEEEKVDVAEESIKEGVKKEIDALEKEIIKDPNENIKYTWGNK